MLLLFEKVIVHFMSFDFFFNFPMQMIFHSNFHQMPTKYEFLKTIFYHQVIFIVDISIMTHNVVHELFIVFMR